MAKLKELMNLLKKREKIFFNYKDALVKIKGILMNPEKEDTINSYWMPTIIFDKSHNLNRDKLLREFKENNIDGRVFFYPLSSLPMFIEKKGNKVSYEIYSRAINLPSYHDLSKKDIDRICTIIKRYNRAI